MPKHPARPGPVTSDATRGGTHTQGPCLWLLLLELVHRALLVLGDELRIGERLDLDVLRFFLALSFGGDLERLILHLVGGLHDRGLVLELDGHLQLAVLGELERGAGRDLALDRLPRPQDFLRVVLLGIRLGGAGQKEQKRCPNELQKSHHNFLRERDSGKLDPPQESGLTGWFRSARGVPGDLLRDLGGGGLSGEPPRGACTTWRDPDSRGRPRPPRGACTPRRSASLKQHSP